MTERAATVRTFAPRPDRARQTPIPQAVTTTNTARPGLVHRLLYMSAGGNQCCESDRVLRHLPRS